MTRDNMSAGMITHVNGDNVSLSLGWKVYPRWGLPNLGFTEHNVPRTIDIGDGEGPFVYSADDGFTKSAIRQQSRMNVDTLKTRGFLDSTGIDRDKLERGYYDGAPLSLFLFNFEDLSLGIVELINGYLGEVSVQAGRFEAEFRGLLELFQTEIVYVGEKNCNVVEFGDFRCKVKWNPDVWAALTAYVLTDEVAPVTHNGRQFVCTTAGTTGASEPTWNTTIDGTTADGSVVWTTKNSYIKEVTVDVVTDLRTFTVAGTLFGTPERIFENGHVVATSGPNVGRKFQIDTWDEILQEVVLFEEDAYAWTNGETLQLIGGCARSYEACDEDHKNTDNMRAYPFAPGDEVLVYDRNRGVSSSGDDGKFF